MERVPGADDADARGRRAGTMSGQDAPAVPPSSLAFLAGGGEMGERIRAFDWSKNPLGPPEGWPQSLRTAVRIMLTSRQPFWIGWGEELITLYNDPYKSIIGGKHPRMLGQPTSVVWREIWDIIAPLLQKAMNEDEGPYIESQLLIMERHGYPEETYYTYSYTPIPREDGRAGGIICANTDDTQRVIGERQLALLRRVAAEAADARSWREACARAASALASNPRDLPFALIYVQEPGGSRCVLAGAAGIERGHQAAPETVEPAAPGPWPLDDVMRSREALLVEDLPAAVQARLPTGAWREPPQGAVLLPLAPSGETGHRGVLVVGLSPFRLFDEGYRNFLSLVASQVSAGIARARAYEEEKKRSEALEELDRAKTAFFSNVSHEFRTPLTLLLGPVEEMLDAPAGRERPENRERLGVVHRNALRMLRLVNTLLDFARLEAGRVQATYEPTDLGSLTADLASAFRSAVERAGLALAVACEPLPGAYVDRDMWEKIVLNLLSNAFKHTFDGEIRIDLRTVGDRAQLSVRDTGTGIPAEEIPHLFERFHRVQGARGRSQEGTGIGLALVHELVELHGGQVHVESALDRGSTFTVSIPLGSAHLPAERTRAERPLEPTKPARKLHAAEALGWLPDGPDVVAGPDSDATDPQPSATAARVLLADDNADMRDYVRRLLAPHYHVEAVADGAAALAAARERPPDLVLSDVMMPKLDGFALIGRLRADPRTRTVPVILLSARAGEESRVEGLTAGADDYLVKPFGARELLARVEAHLKLARLRREAEESLREADRRKDEFLAVLAHELRNPLAPLRNALEIVRRSDDRQVREQARDMMERQVGHMVRLIDDLLDVSRISRGNLPLRQEKVGLAAVVGSAVETARPLIEAGGHELTLTLPKEPVHLHADPIRLAQVFANLLNNSAKYSKRGGHISVGALRQGSDVTISVRDDGIGIAAAELPRIFDMFAQVDRTAEPSQGGLGIGLALVKGVVQMHGGSVEARSDGLGRGSEFVVRLPAIAEERRTEPPAPARHGRPALPRRRVLVAEDNRDSAESLEVLLRLMGNEVRTVHDGLAAVEAAAEFRPELILMDVGMPRLNGLDAARRIREQSWGKELRIFALTGWGQDADRERSADAGCDGHLIKPVDSAAIERLLAGLSATAIG